MRNCSKQPKEKQLGASTSETLGNNTKGLEKAVSPVSNRGMGHDGCKWCDEFEKLQEMVMMKAIEPELKSSRATTGSVAVVKSVLNIPQKVTSTRWAGFRGKT